MSRPILGNWINGGAAATLDLPRLLESRLLLQAASGLGKSWALRRLLEVTAGQVQQIIIDPEGEFASLREKHDLLIVAGTGGDALAHPKTAALLATRLLETGVSAVIDIYDLKKRDREDFVRLFTESLVNAPKSLWHAVLLAIDEIHMFCDENENAKSTQAVIDVATRGRKRGLCLVAATQRIADFNKSAAAQLRNKLIGGTTLDVDVKRAAFELGKSPKETMEMLRSLNAGEFFGYGPALSPEVRLLKIGDVETTHPKVGHRQMAPPKPTAAIKAILPKLADLPKEAEEEMNTIVALRRKVAELERRPQQVVQAAPAVDTSVIEVRGYENGYKRGWNDCRQEAATIRAEVKTAVDKAFELDIAVGVKTEVPPPRPQPRKGIMRTPTWTERNPGLKSPLASKANGGEKIPEGEAKILAALIQYPAGLTRDQLIVIAGYKRSTRDAYIARLRDRGYVTIGGDGVEATPEGIAAMPDAQPLPTGDELQAFWMNRLPEGEAKVLAVLIGAYPDTLTRDTVTERAGYKKSTRDAYLSRLSAKELVEEPARGEVRAAEALFS